MTKVLIVGATGMLGAAVRQSCEEAGYTTHTSTERADIRISIGHVIEGVRPDVVINCAGAIPARCADTVKMIRANALVPAVLAEITCRQNIRMIHVSTDCVFSGTDNQRPSTVDDLPDPADLYGRSKLVGEIDAPHVLVLRTSFIGTKHGLLRWLLDQKRNATVQGWGNARWSGSTVNTVAEAIITEVPTTRTGVQHLATEEPISKASLLTMIRNEFRLDLGIERCATPIINRALVPTIALPPVTPDLLRALDV